MEMEWKLGVLFTQLDKHIYKQIVHGTYHLMLVPCINGYVKKLIRYSLLYKCAMSVPSVFKSYIGSYKSIEGFLYLVCSPTALYHGYKQYG